MTNGRISSDAVIMILRDEKLVNLVVISPYSFKKINSEGNVLVFTVANPNQNTIAGGIGWCSMLDSCSLTSNSLRRKYKRNRRSEFTEKNHSWPLKMM
jgi:hypothetical protein